VAQAFLPAQGRQECLPHNDACANRLDSKSGFLKKSSESGKGSPKAGSENGKYTGYTDFLQRGNEALHSCSCVVYQSFGP